MLWLVLYASAYLFALESRSFAELKKRWACILRYARWFFAALTPRQHVLHPVPLPSCVARLHADSACVGRTE
jgi:hypothetical protein